MASSETTKLFADNLQELIANSGKNMKELAAEIGISAAALSKYQNDGAAANIDALVKIAKYFGVTTDWLLGIGDIKTPEPNLLIAHAYTKLSESALKWLHQVATAKVDPLSKPVNLLEIISLFLENYAFRRLLGDIVDLKHEVEEYEEHKYDERSDSEITEHVQKHVNLDNMAHQIGGLHVINDNEFNELQQGRINRAIKDVIDNILYADITNDGPLDVGPFMQGPYIFDR